MTTDSFSDYEMLTLSHLKIDEEPKVFHVYFVSYKSCEKTKTQIYKNKKMRACVTSFEEVSIDDYLNEYNHQRNTRVIDLSKWETPPECEL